MCGWLKNYTSWDDRSLHLLWAFADEAVGKKPFVSGLSEDLNDMEARPLPPE